MQKIFDLRLMFAAMCVLPALLGCAPGATRVEPASVVALVSVPVPARYSIILDKHPDATASLERSMFFAADMTLGEHRLADAMAAAPGPGPSFLATLSATASDALVEGLRRPGVSVVVAPETHGDRIEFVSNSNYAALQPQAATFVEVIPRAFGFWSTYPAMIYRPWVRLEYRVYDARERKVIKTGFAGTGLPPFEGDFIAVAQDDAFAFQGFEAVLIDPVRVAAALRATVRQVALSLAQKL